MQTSDRSGNAREVSKKPASQRKLQSKELHVTLLQVTVAIDDAAPSMQTTWHGSSESVVAADVSSLPVGEVKQAGLPISLLGKRISVGQVDR